MEFFDPSANGSRYFKRIYNFYVDENREADFFDLDLDRRLCLDLNRSYSPFALQILSENISCP